MRRLHRILNDYCHTGDYLGALRLSDNLAAAGRHADSRFALRIAAAIADSRRRAG
jgi:hypothetical protein